MSKAPPLDLLPEILESLRTWVGEFRTVRQRIEQGTLTYLEQDDLDHLRGLVAGRGSKATPLLQGILGKWRRRPMDPAQQAAIKEALALLGELEELTRVLGPQLEDVMSLDEFFVLGDELGTLAFVAGHQGKRLPEGHG